jgi:DNA-directed RNA polymerase sigma subunit (sigma70/sigma32)
MKPAAKLNGHSRKWDRARAEKLRAAMTDQQIAALRARSQTDLNSLTLDEVGVIFLVTRDLIRLIEFKAPKRHGGHK